MVDLQEAKTLAAEIHGLRRIINQLLEAADGLRSPSLSGMPRSTTATDGKDGLAEAIDRAEMYYIKLAALLEVQKELEQYIEDLPGIERAIMRCRFIEGLSAEKTADALNINTRRVFRRTASAIRRMRENGAEVK